MWCDQHTEKNNRKLYQSVKVNKSVKILNNLPKNDDIYDFFKIQGENKIPYMITFTWWLHYMTFFDSLNVNVSFKSVWILSYLSWTQPTDDLYDQWHLWEDVRVFDEAVQEVREDAQSLFIWLNGMNPEGGGGWGGGADSQLSYPVWLPLRAGHQCFL